MTRLFHITRYLILIPILGLLLAAAFFFIFGGLNLISLLFELTLARLGVGPQSGHLEPATIIFEVVEYVHFFLVGTVLYITAMGFIQLFIKKVDLPGWLKIDSTEDLETNLIGVTVVVLAVNFMGVTFSKDTTNLLQYGTGIALPIAALGIFVGMRAWAAKLNKEHGAHSSIPPAPVTEQSITQSAVKIEHE